VCSHSLEAFLEAVKFLGTASREPAHMGLLYHLPDPRIGERRLLDPTRESVIVLVDHVLEDGDRHHICNPERAHQHYKKPDGEYRSRHGPVDLNLGGQQLSWVSYLYFARAAVGHHAG